MQTDPAELTAQAAGTAIEFYWERTLFPSLLWQQAALVIALILLSQILCRPVAKTATWKSATWLACCIAFPMVTGLLLGVAGFVRDIQTAENNPPRGWEYIVAGYLAIAKWQVGYWISLALYGGVVAILVRRAFREQRVVLKVDVEHRLNP